MVTLRLIPLLLGSLLAQSCATTTHPAMVAFDAVAPTVLITGANRGLGLEFARQYAAKGWNVIASCRNPEAADELQQLATIHSQLTIEQLDVTRDDEVAALKARYRDQPIDVLLNNAGIYGTLATQSLGDFDFEDAIRVFDINTLGALRVSEAFLDNVLASEQKKIISLGGGMGTQSIGRLFAGHYFMKMSKAAHLMAMGVMQTELADTGLQVVMISPGRVDTELMRDSGWTGPSITAAESAQRVIARIEQLEPAMNGRLILDNGKVLPW